MIKEKNVLTSITTKLKKTVKQESDHNSKITKFDLTWSSEINKERIEIFNFKDKKGQEMFKEMTSNNTKLS